MRMEWFTQMFRCFSTLPSMAGTLQVRVDLSGGVKYSSQLMTRTLVNLGKIEKSKQ